MSSVSGRYRTPRAGGLWPFRIAATHSVVLREDRGSGAGAVGAAGLGLLVQPLELGRDAAPVDGDDLRAA